MARADSIHVSSGVSHRTGEGFVTVVFGDEAGQLSVTDAKGFGLSIIEAAMAADGDAAFYRLMSTGDRPLPSAEIARFLRDLRVARGGAPDGAGRTSATFCEESHRG